LKTTFGAGATCVHGKIGDWQSGFRDEKRICWLGDQAAVEAKDAAGTNQYSHDLAKVAEIECLIVSSRNAAGPDMPDLRVACPTSRWLRAALLSTDEVMKKANTLRTRTLIIAAKDDTAVDTQAQKAFCRAAPDCCRIEVAGAGHELLVETEDIRGRFFDLFDRFISSGREPAKVFCEQYQVPH
jgi:lysophospholipase